MRVPLLDLKAQYESIGESAVGAIKEVVAASAFAGGPFVEQFEKEFACFCQCRYAVGVSSGTDALWIALLGLGVGEGDEVITAPNSFIATAEAISRCGATPVFVDVDRHTYNLNPELLEDAVSSKTKAIIPVHLYGQMADMDAVMSVARQYNLLVVEDAAQAHGGEYNGKRAGSIGNAGCFSFYPGKNLGAFGEAGAVVTNDGKLAEKMRMFRDHGQEKKYHHNVLGWNSRMDGIQGAVLSIKLKHLHQWNEARRENAAKYSALLDEYPEVRLPNEAKGRKHVYHIYSVHLKERDAVIQKLAAKDIYCGIHYPVPIHMQKPYSSMERGKGHFPVTEQCASEQLSLPMFPELTDDQLCFVAKELKNVLIE